MFEVYVLSLFPFFSYFNSCFSLFSLLICDITCLLSLGFLCFSVLKHARLLDLVSLYFM